MNKFTKQFKQILIVLFSFSFPVLATEVLPISEKRIINNYNQIKIYSERRDKARIVSGGIFTVGAFAALYYFLRDSSDHKSLEELTKKVGTLEEKTKDKDLTGAKGKEEEKEGEESKKTGFFSGLYNGVKNMGTLNFWKGASSLGLSWGAYFAKDAALKIVKDKVFSVFNFNVPKSLHFGKYLIDTHNLSWYIENKTVLKNTLISLMTVLNNPNSTQEQINSKLSFLVVQVEKVLGFMYYVQDYIDIEINALDKDYSKTIINRLKLICGKFQDIANSRENIKSSLISLISQIRDFNGIAVSAGFEDEQADINQEVQGLVGEEVSDVFDILKLIVDENFKNKVFENRLNKQKIAKLKLKLAQQRSYQMEE